MPRNKSNQTPPTPARRLRNNASVPPQPPEPNVEPIKSPLETNPYNPLDESDSSSGQPSPSKPSPKRATVSTLNPLCVPPFFPPSNQDLSSKLDHILNLIDTTNKNFSVMKTDVDTLLSHHNSLPIKSNAPTPIPTATPSMLPSSSVLSNTIGHTTSSSTVLPPTTSPTPVVVPVTTPVDRKPVPVPISSTTNLTTPDNLFGQNEFSVALTNNTKLKFSTMETSLKDCVLQSDNQRDMKSMYESITKAITFLLNQELELLPRFNDLHRKIDFKSLFLRNLHGATLSKCNPVFMRLGTLIRSRLLSKDCIDPTKCPKASLKIITHSLMDGWQLFEMLLKSRLVICGAPADFDLDRVRSNLTFLPNESYTEFYIRTQHIINEYDMNTRGERVPITKITDKFINELSRAPEYVPYLARYQTELVDHILVFGDSNYDYLPPILPSSIHDILVKVKAPDRPSKLVPGNEPSSIPMLAPTTYLLPSKIPSHTTDSEVVNVNYPKDLSAIISVLEQSVDPECTSPILCYQAQSKQRCKACLQGYHEEVHCYARGPQFLPPTLRRRIMVYNQTNGDKPPPDHQYREYRPQGVTPDHRKPHPKQSSHHRKDTRPFSNYNTKTSKQTASIRSFQLSDDKLVPTDTPHDIDTDTSPTINSLKPFDPPVDTHPTPTITSFIKHQESFLDNIIKNDALNDNDDGPVVCSMLTTPHPTICHLSRSLPPGPHSFAHPTDVLPSASFHTPKQLLDVVTKAHVNNKPLPDKKFLTHFSTQLPLLPRNHFTTFCNMHTHCDQGANVGSVMDLRYFLFYVPSPSSVQQVGGDMITSPGWGGVLYHINNKLYLQAPTYYCPSNPQNTFSPSCLKNYSNFNKVIVDTNESITLIDQQNYQSNIPFLVHNGLDYLTLEIMAFKQDTTPDQPKIASVNHKPVRRSPRLISRINDPTSDKPPQRSVRFSPDTNDSASDLVQIHTSDTPTTVNNDLSTAPPQPVDIPDDIIPLPKSVLQRIATYYILLHSPTSPRIESIKLMNELLGNTFSPNIPTTLPLHSSQPILAHTALPTSDLTAEILVPVIDKLSRSQMRPYNPLQTWMSLHLSTMHASQSVLDPMIKRDLLSDLPPALKRATPSTCTCHICNLRKATKLPRGKLVDKTTLPPFQRIHVDFSFFGYKSIRGFTSALDICCGTTSYPVGFPGKSKTPPLETIRWFISVIRNMGFETTFVRVDEDGALAKSSEFCKLLVDMNCVLETTGGGNSTNNGIVERGNRSRANMVRAQLATLNLLIHKVLPSDMDIREFWCYAYQHSCFLQRRLYNRSIDDIPYFLVHKKRPSALELIILGSIMTIINPSKNLSPKLDSNRAKRGYFLGFSNHTKIRNYWTPDNPRTVLTSSHCIIEDIATMAQLQNAFSTMDFHADPIKEPPQLIKDLVVSPEDLKILDDPFPDSEILKYSFVLPPFPATIGFQLADDPLLNVPYIKGCDFGSFAYNGLPAGKRRNYYIVGINKESPITATYTRELLQQIQKDTDRTLNISLIHRGQTDQSSTLEITRAMFSQMPSILHNRPVIASSQLDLPETYSHFITAPTKPDKPKSIFAALKSPFRSNWKAAAWNQYKKNHNIAVFTIPFLKSDVPAGSQILRSQLVPEIKTTDVPSIFELKVRHVIVGTPQVHKVDFDNSYSPTADITTIRLQIAFTCARNYSLAVIDVKNAFQNTIAPPESRVYVTLPPMYLEWAIKDLKLPLDFSQDYLLQMLNSNQGTKNAGNLWYNLLIKVLIKYGMIRSTVDHGYMVKCLDNGEYIYISIATDDLLVSYLHQQTFNDLVKYLEKYFELTVQNGQVLKFLGIRIIQSDIGISLDQGEYVFEILEYFWGLDLDKIKTLTSPMRYDSAYENELFQAIPLSESELLTCCIEYKGGYRFWTGKLTFLGSQTRTDIAFATQRLSEYNHAPTRIAFESIVRVLRYLAHDILRPIMYPRQDFSGSSTVTWYATPENKLELKVTNVPNIFADAELARCIATRHSYYCIIVTVLNVVVFFKIKKTSKVMVHTTASEMKAAYDGVRHVEPIRSLFAFNGYPLPEPSPLFCDNAAVNAIVDSERMTPRCRHLDIPIAFLHETKDRVYKMQQVKTLLMLADMGTKPNTPKTLQLYKYWSTGAQFLPKEGHTHYDLLQMQLYEKNFVQVQQILKTMT